MNLHDHHRAMLEQESGIRPEVVAARDYRTVTTKADLERLGFSAKQRNTPALLIPIHGPAGDVRLYQARPDNPRINKGKPVKYETPHGSSMALDVPPTAREKVGDPNAPLFVTEGVKKGDALVSHGLCAVALIGVWNFRGTNAHGGKTALPEWEYVALNDRRVYIVFDSDVMLKREVHAALVRLKAMLEHRGARVLLIYLPTGDGAVKQGVDDFLVSGKSIDELLALASPQVRTFDKADTAERGKADATGRPEIVVNDRHLRDITADALAALEAANVPPTLYMRGTIAARVNGDKIEALTATALKGRLDRVADFVKVTYKTNAAGASVAETHPARPPADVPPDILSQPELWFPRLEGIVNAPVFLPGELLAEDGYSAEHGLLLRLKGLSNLRADMPVDEALARLRDVFVEFPFVEAAGYAHTLAMTLQPFVRPLITGATPLYLIDAPARGTGKGLLAEAAMLIPYGYVVPTMSLPRESDELRKGITSVLLEARPMVFLDNVTYLGAAPLHTVLTSEIWHDRILGKSESATVPNTALWLASGNNVTLSDEMIRRVVPIRLDAGVERPEERTGFRHPNLAAHVRAHRSELVSACLSIVQAWVDAGVPQGKGALGRYESWVAVMSGILEVCGVCGFLGGRERLHAEADSETKEWAALCDRWHEAHGETLVTARDVFDVARVNTLLLDLWGGRSQQGALQRFGHALGGKRDRVFGRWVIRSAGRDTHAGSHAYRLERCPEKTQQTRQTQQNSVETPSGTRAGFVAGLGQNPPKPAQNPQTKNSVPDGVSETLPDDLRVCWVLNGPATKDGEDDDDLCHLVGKTEGEL